MQLKNTKLIAITACACLAAAAGSIAIAGPGKDSKPGTGAGSAMPPLPAGWTTEDMQACMLAGTPGKMHDELRKLVGVWTGSNQMRMSPDSEAMTSDTTWTITSIMDGRYIKTEVSGDMPGMGAFTGMGLTGFDNVTQQFVGNWIDNHGTGIMHGKGERSGDGKTMTMLYTHNCPVTKKPATMREVQRLTSDNVMAIEFYCNCPKTGKEFKCMQMDLKKQS